MDGSYKQMALRVSWRLTPSSHEDSGRNHEQDFEAFAVRVAENLRPSGRVTCSVTGGEDGKYRDLTFTSDRPIAQADWTEAVQLVAEDCSVLADRNDWAFE